MKPPRRGSQKTPAKPRRACRTRVVAAEDLARLVNGVAHPDRVRLARAIRLGSATHGELSADTGLKPGPLYHHLREMERAGLVNHGQRRFQLTVAGKGLMSLLDRHGLAKPRPPARR